MDNNYIDKVIEEFDKEFRETSFIGGEYTVNKSKLWIKDFIRKALQGPTREEVESWMPEKKAFPDDIGDPKFGWTEELSFNLCRELCIDAVMKNLGGEDE